MLGNNSTNMKTKILAVLFALSVTSTVAVAETKEFQTIELPAQKIGSIGSYSLGYTVRTDKPAGYYMAVESKKIDINNTSVKDDGGLAYNVFRAEVAKSGFSKMPWIQVRLERSQIEAASKTGRKFTITSGKNTFTFEITGQQFSSFIADADAHDDYKQAQDSLAAIKQAAEKLKADAQANSKLFDADALRAYAEKGNAKIRGQAFLKTQGGDVKVGAGNTVWLVPDVPWATGLFDLIDRGFSSKDLPQSEKNIMERVVRSTDADASGNFEFDDVPPGKYQIETSITWLAGDSRTGGRVIRQVIVGDGQTQKVMLTH